MFSAHLWAQEPELIGEAAPADPVIDPATQPIENSTAVAPQSQDLEKAIPELAQSIPELAQSQEAMLAASRYEVGLGAGFPDYYFLETKYRLTQFWNIRIFYTPPMPFYLDVQVPADEEVLKSRLKAGTPPTTYESVVRYKTNVGLESQHRPFEGSGFYFSYGVGYRKIHVTAEGEPDLFVCLVTPDVPCDKDHETWASGAKINLATDIEISAYLLRSTLGWRWDWSNGVYVDWAWMGLAIPFFNKQSITVRSSLIADATIPEAEEILGEMEAYLEQKKASIIGRVVSNVEKFDAMKLPVGSLSIGYRF